MLFSECSRTAKWIISVIAGMAVYLAFTLLMGLGVIWDAPTIQTIFSLLPELWAIKLLVSAGIVLLLVWIRSNNLNIEAKTVGQGQHGTARFATEEEQKKAYVFVSDRQEQTPGFVVGRKHHQWMIDDSDMSVLLVAPPGAGKTKREFIPSIIYNALVNANTNGKGASMILTDCKGELLQKTGTFLKQCGYRVAFLNFNEPLHSACFNLLNDINRHIDCYKNAVTDREKLLHYGHAERCAKILASSMVDNMGVTSQSEASNYFQETSRGLLTGMALLVSEYGAQNERHIISVFRLIIELNGLTEDSDQNIQKSRLQELLTYIHNERIYNYVGPATSADMRTGMNVFSSALGKLVQFIDAELEPMVCGHSVKLNAEDFVKYPTAIFLVCPDSNTTRHFFASLFIRFLMNDLISMADKRPTLTLERRVFSFWDEFGNMPPIKEVDNLLSAARSRGIRFLLSLQSHAQMRKNYDQNMMKIILDCCQMTMVTYVSPNSRETAEEISRTLGNKTIQSGSVTKGKGKSQNLQMMSRRLKTADELMKMEPGEFIIMKAGTATLGMQTTLPIYWDYIEPAPDYVASIQMELIPISYLTSEKIKRAAGQEQQVLIKGMFDE